MINWDMIENLLKRSRPNFTGQFRVAIYSRMPYGDGQEATAENHIKFMKLVLDRDPRFRVEGVYSEFGVPFTDLSAMQEYQHIIPHRRPPRPHLRPRPSFSWDLRVE